MRDFVAAGWEALSRGVWDEAVALVRDVDDDPEALEVPGVAYWWLDAADATIDSRERAYRLSGRGISASWVTRSESTP
jgi:hypothetical protein